MLKIEEVLCSNYGTANKFKDIVLSLYNYQTYEKADFFGFLCNADAEHQALLFELLKVIGDARGGSNTYISQLHNLISDSYRGAKKTV